MTSLLLIAFVALVVCYGAVKRPGIALAYALMAGQLNHVLFEEVNLHQYRYALPILALIGVQVLHFRRQQLRTNVRNLFSSSILQGFLIFTAYVFVYCLSIGGAYEIEYLEMFIFPGFVMFLIGALMMYRYDMLKDVVFGVVLFTALALLHLQLIGEGLGNDLSWEERKLLSEETGIGALKQGRMAGSLALVCIMMALTKRSEWVASIMAILFAVAVTWMAMIGTRGALVSLLSALFLYLLVSPSKSRSVRRLVIFAFFLTPILLASGITDALLVERMQWLFESDNLESMRRVRRVYIFADNVFEHFVIGFGPGGWDKYIWDGVLARRYLHNILMEVQLEYGVIGLMIILFMVFSGIRMTIRICSDTGAGLELKCLSMLWVYYFVSTQFSGSLIQGNALLFALTGTLGASYFWYSINKKMQSMRRVALDARSSGIVVPAGSAARELKYER